MSRAIATTTIVVVVLSIARAQAGEWLVSPFARISTTYTDNPRLLPDGGVSSAGATGELSANLQRRTERSEFSLQPRFRSARYREDESLDSDDQLLDGTYKYVTERSQWNGAANFTRDTTLTSEVGLTGLVRSNRRHEAVTLSGGPTFLLTERLNAGAQAYWLDSHYVDAERTGLIDYEYRALSLFSGLALSELSDLTLTAQGSELLVPSQQTRTRDATVRLSWRYEPYSQWTLNLSAGPAYVESDLGNDSGAVFDADLQRSGERWTLNANAGRSLTPTGRGVLTRRDRIVMGINRRITEHLGAGASAQWIRNQDLLPRPGIAFYEVEYGRLDLNLSWQFAQHWSIALMLSGATQDYDTATDRAENYRTSLSIVWNGQQQPL